METEYSNDDLRERLKDVVACLTAAGAREVYLFGSRVKNWNKPGSDVDLAVAGLPPENFLRAFHDAMQLLHSDLDLVDLDEDSLFAKHLKDSGDLVRVG